jgi:hypothetical protein
MFFKIVCAWLLMSSVATLLPIASFFGGFFRAFITGQFWYGVLFATLAIFVFEAAYKYSLGVEGDEYARTYLGKAWHFLYALYEKLFSKAKTEEQKFVADIKKRF